MSIANFYRGDTKKYKFTFTDANGAPVNITGWEIWLTLKLDVAAVDANAEMQVKHVVGNDVADDPVNGVANLTATSVNTTIPVGTYQYDMQRVIPGSPPDVRTLLRGKVKVLQDVTLDNA